MSVISRIRLIQFRAGYNLPVHAGREQGIFERHGLEIDITYTPGSLFLSEALRKGEFDIGHTGADDIVADVEDFGGGPSSLFIFMGLHSGLLSVVGAPGMTSVESLRGKELAVDARASGFVFILEKLLRNNGFGPDDYRFVEIGGVDRRYRALLEGKVAGTILLPPFAGNAATQGCHILARGDQIMREYQGTVGAAQRSWAEKNSGLLVGYIRAYVEATRWCFDIENRPTCLELLGKYNDLEGKAAEETLNALLDSDYGMYPNAAVNIAGLKSVIDLRAEMGFLKAPLPPVEKFIDLSYYERAVGQSSALLNDDSHKDTKLRLRPGDR
jgi:ABC-type nitrate/sulfonate/bicarbonate transport system substrate-binding protein